MTVDKNILSFIIPTYNSGDSLQKAVLSIISGMPSGAEFEIIVVDDGSTDTSISVLKSSVDYTEKHRIRIVNTPHIGAGGARNYGVSIATGDYLMFVDADDEIIDVKQAYECAVNSNNYDLVYFSQNSQSTTRFESNKLIISVLGLSLKGGFDSGPCSKLYRRSVLIKNGIEFPGDIYIGEDLVFNLRFLKHIRNFRCIGKGIYKIHTNKTSVTHRLNFQTETNNAIRLISSVKSELSDKEADTLTDKFALKQFLSLIIKSAKSSDSVLFCANYLIKTRKVFLDAGWIEDYRVDNSYSTYTMMQKNVLRICWHFPFFIPAFVFVMRLYYRDNKEPETEII